MTTKIFEVRMMWQMQYGQTFRIEAATAAEAEKRGRQLVENESMPNPFKDEAAVSRIFLPESREVIFCKVAIVPYSEIDAREDIRDVVVAHLKQCGIANPDNFVEIIEEAINAGVEWQEAQG